MMGQGTAGGRNITRLRKELSLLEAAFGADRVFWHRHLLWVMVEDFPLPPGYNRPTTHLVVLIPEGYGYGPAPKHCFVDRELRCRGKRLPHYFQERDVAPQALEFYEKGWAYLCVHPTRWDPTRDTLLTYLAQVRLFLSDPWRWG